MEFELPKINVSFEYDKEKDEIVLVINGVEKRVKTADMITEMEKMQEQNTALEQDTVPFDFELYQAGLMDMPKGMIEVLDKIRAEIRKKIAFNSFNEGYVLYDDIVEIIDKYKAESENKE